MLAWDAGGGRFPTIGHTTLSAVQTTKAKVRALNEQLHLSDKAAVIGDKAAVVQQSLSTGISSAWARASAAATQAAERTKEFEAKHKLRDRTLLATFRGMNFVNTRCGCCASLPPWPRALLRLQVLNATRPQPAACVGAPPPPHGEATAEYVVGGTYMQLQQDVRQPRLHRVANGSGGAA